LPGSPEAPLVPSTLRLIDPVSKQIVDKLTIPRQGTYPVTDGKITFQPLHGFTGVGTPVTYQVLDKNGTAAGAERPGSVAAPGPPVANPDTITTLQGRTVIASVLDNDKPGPTGAALKPGSVRLLTATQPVMSLVVPGQGKYSVKADGKVVFDPLPAF